jgi:hypothetical protein
VTAIRFAYKLKQFNINFIDCPPEFKNIFEILLVPVVNAWYASVFFFKFWLLSLSIRGAGIAQSV